MSKENKGYVYILKYVGYGSNNRGEVKYYVGSTTDLKRRLKQHRHKKGIKWAKKFKYRLKSYYLYVEECDNIYEARKREQEVKNWSHDKKRKKALEYSGKC